MAKKRITRKASYTTGAIYSNFALPEDGLEQMAPAMMTGIREWTLEGRKPRRRRGH